MKGRVFLDSNILIYAAGGRDSVGGKLDAAMRVVSESDFGLSTQVLGEFVKNVQSPKKMATPLSDEEVDAWLTRLTEFPVVAADTELVERAIYHQRRHKISYWDGQIVAAAERLGAAILYSEDLSRNQLYGAMRCINPFREI
jgi:predicted nucleic acid-binding protein